MDTIIKALIAKGWKKGSEYSNTFYKNDTVVIVTEDEVTIYPAGEWVPEQYCVADFKPTPNVGIFYLPKLDTYVEFV